MTKHRFIFSGLLLLVLFLAMAPTALASSTWYVDGVNGNDTNDCMSSLTACKTIGHAISLVSKDDLIMVARATYTENLTIGFSLKIIGSGAKTTIIDGGWHNTVVTIPNPWTHVTLSKLTIRKGYASFGGGIINHGTLTVNNSTISGNTGNSANQYGGKGGGIFTNGTLTVNNSTISGNSANQDGGKGGGIFTNGTLTVNNSTISGNYAGWGGGIAVNSGTLTVNNSTISRNISPWGGIAVNSGTLTVNNSTISGNSASGIPFAGGGIYNYIGTATLQNSIVANNHSGRNCKGTMTSNGYNLSSDGSCNFSNTGDLNNTKPNLGPLQNNGGPTQTRKLLEGSPAIDAGNPNGCTDGQGHLLTTDQRGRPRPNKEGTGGCDMGAFERQSD